MEAVSRGRSLCLSMGCKLEGNLIFFFLCLCSRHQVLFEGIGGDGEHQEPGENLERSNICKFVAVCLRIVSMWISELSMCLLSYPEWCKGLMEDLKMFPACL